MRINIFHLRGVNSFFENSTVRMTVSTRGEGREAPAQGMAVATIASSVTGSRAKVRL